MRKTLRKIIVLSLSLFLILVSVNKVSVSANTNYSITPPSGSYVITNKKTNIVPGVVESEIIYNTPDGKNPVSGYAVDINLSNNVKIMATSKDYNKPGVQTVKKMAEAAEKATDRNIVAAINADLNWSGTGLSNGPLIIDGQVYSDKADIFFGITKDNQAVIGDAAKFNQIKNDLEQAIRGMGWLVRDGEVVNNALGLAPRTAVGIRADGSVFFYVVEGRIFPRSNGTSTKELAEVMKSYGAVQALNLDGGGSTTYLAKLEGESSLELRSIPSDGAERESISSLLVYSIVGDGKFDHAYISSDNDVYTPTSEVQFSALGVDNAGGAAPMPSNLTWNLADSTYGSIDQNGRFVSNGTEGEVVIQLLNSTSKVVGETTIEIRVPNEIHFLNEEYSFGFDEVTDFGLRLTYNQREVSFKDGDIIWEFDEKLGIMSNNVFTTNSEESVKGVIKATVTGSTISKDITVDIGKLPIIIFDFENDAINEKWNASSVNGAQSVISIVDKDSGEPVRFGDQSLRIDFDFTTQIRNPGGAYAGFTDREGLEELGVTFQLPGAPTGLGMYIYGTEEVQGLWLRTGIGVEGNTNWKAFDLAPEGKGIDWLGWKYVEVNLTDFAGPYTILPGQFIRVMLTANSFGGEPLRPVGNIYVDNITVTYGTNVDDIDSPEINHLLVNDHQVVNGEVFNTNNITVQSSFGDVVNKYTSGIDYESVSVYVDGVNYRGTEYQALNLGENTVYLQNVNLTDGTHEIEVVVSDLAGNEVSESRYITIDTSTDNEVYLESEESVVLGQKYEITLKADEIDNLDSVYTSLRISRTLEDYEVEFSSAFEGTVEYLNGVQLLNIQANRINNDDVDYVYTIKSKIATDLTESSIATYSVNIGSFEYVDDQTDERFLKGYSKLPQNLSIAAPINITSNTIIVGHDGVFTVSDFEGNKLENAKVFEVTSDGKLELGVTDENGNFVTDRFSNAVVSFIVVAEHNENLSFEFKGQSFESTGEIDGMPFAIHLNGTKYPESSKNISWLSNVAGSEYAFIEYALKENYENNGDSSLVRSVGTQQQHSFDGASDPTENAIVNVNNVLLTGLISGREYVYRVGNGDVWSEFREFSTNYKSSDSTFLIIGDVQTENYEGFREDLAGISNNGINYDFSVQIGDLVDDAGTYSNWYEVLAAIEESGINHLDMIQVLGNHEYYGDINADKSAAIFNFPSSSIDYYSVEYQNVYMGVINYTMNRARLTEALQWLVEDANQSNSTWKVLLTHQPPYYLNPQGGNELFNELLPQYVQAAGIDFVFSGHDHAYARTEPLIDGQPSEDGVVYIVTGALGEKRYTSVNNPNFHFATVNDTFDSIYLTIETTEDKFSIVTREVVTGEIIDSYEKVLAETDDQFYVINDDRLISEDGKHNRPLAGYVGFAKTSDGDIVYLMDGEFFKGLLVLGDEIYYFDEETGYVFTGETEIFGLPTTFDENGKLESGGTGFVGEGNRIRYYDKLTMFKGWNDIDGSTYYFDNVSGYMYRGIRKIGYQVYEFKNDGKFVQQLKLGFNVTDEGTYYIDDNGHKLKGWQEIDGNTYYFSMSDTGYMRTGVSLVGGKFYEFGPDGVYISETDGGFVETPEGTYYLNHENKKLKGWQVINEDTYYFSMSNTGFMRTGITTIAGEMYEFTNDGKLIQDSLRGFVKTTGGTYYIDENGYRLNGWQEIEGDLYYFSKSSTGYMRVGVSVVDGTEYRFGTDGKLQGTLNFGGFNVTPNGTYFLDANGDKLKGWQKIDGDTYYFSMSDTGYMRTGVTVIAGETYEFGADGKLLVDVLDDFVKTPEGTYYLDDNGNQLKGWQLIGGSYYYFSQSSTGFMRVGKSVVDGTEYEFAENGKLKGTINLGGFNSTTKGTYYLDDNGDKLRGWQEIDGNTYYFSTSDTGFMRTGLSTIGGETYEFTQDGKLIVDTLRGFVKTSAGTYYVDDNGNRLKGWQEIDGDVYYFSQSSTGFMRVGKSVVDGTEYEFATNGKLKGTITFDGFNTTSEGTYYLDVNGNKLRGWQEIDGDTYYFSTSDTGFMRTGLSTIGGETYEFTQDGKLIADTLRGFVKTSAGTYYVDDNGNRLKGWQVIDGDLYYFSQSSTGFMRVGKSVVDGTEYEFAINGKLNGTITFDGFNTASEGTYYLDVNGNKLRGWQEIDGDTYYFSTSDTGYMRTGVTTIDGEPYEFTQDGKLIKERLVNMNSLNTDNLVGNAPELNSETEVTINQNLSNNLEADINNESIVEETNETNETNEINDEVDYGWEELDFDDIDFEAIVSEEDTYVMVVIDDVLLTLEETQLMMEEESDFDYDDLDYNELYVISEKGLYVLTKETVWVINWEDLEDFDEIFEDNIWEEVETEESDEIELDQTESEDKSVIINDSFTLLDTVLKFYDGNVYFELDWELLIDTINYDQEAVDNRN